MTATTAKPLKVFISHRSTDKAAVETLVLALREQGIDAWFDKWEIRPGDSIVSKINDGLDSCDAGIIVFSETTQDSRWVDAELGTLIYSRVKDGKALIPVMIDMNAPIPALIRPLARIEISKVGAIVDALLGRSAKPPLGARAATSVQRAVIRLRRANAGLRVEVELDGVNVDAATLPSLPSDVQAGNAGLRVEVEVDGVSVDAATFPHLPSDVQAGRAAFLKSGASRSSAATRKGPLERSSF